MPSRMLSLASHALLVAGVLMALISNRYITEVMGDAALGVAVLAPEPDSPAWQEKIRLRQIADRAYFLGLGLTAAGIVVGLIASLRGTRRKPPDSSDVDRTGIWIGVTALGTILAVAIAYISGEQSVIATGQTVILAVTAVALFMYARDTRKMASITARQLQITEEINYKPLAKLSVMQTEMKWDDIRCPLMLEVLRHVPFIARVDLQLEIDGNLIPTGSDLYDGKEEWVIYASFQHLPGEIRSVLRAKFPSEQDLVQFLGRPSTDKDNIATRVTVTPLILYRAAGSNAATLTSAARSYLQVQINNGVAVYRWMPDVQKSRYRSMVWKGESVGEFALEAEIESS